MRTSGEERDLQTSFDCACTRINFCTCKHAHQAAGQPTQALLVLYIAHPLKLCVCVCVCVCVSRCVEGQV